MYKVDCKSLLGSGRFLEKRSGVGVRLLNTFVKRPTKAVLKAFLDPVLGLSQAGTNAEIYRRTGKWIRNETRRLNIPAGKGKPARVLFSEGPESIHPYHRPAAILHHLFLSGPDVKLNRAAAGAATGGVGLTLAAQKVLQRISENRDMPE